MRYDGDVVFFRHEHHGHDFVNAAQAASVDLADVDGVRLEELLEGDAVLAHFAGGDEDVVGCEGCADGGMAKNVVGGGGLFDEPRAEGSEMGHVGYCFGDGPYLGLVSYVFDLRFAEQRWREEL